MKILRTEKELVELMRDFVNLRFMSEVITHVPYIAATDVFDTVNIKEGGYLDIAKEAIEIIKKEFDIEIKDFEKMPFSVQMNFVNSILPSKVNVIEVLTRCVTDSTLNDREKIEEEFSSLVQVIYAFVNVKDFNLALSFAFVLKEKLYDFWKDKEQREDFENLNSILAEILTLLLNMIDEEISDRIDVKEQEMFKILDPRLAVFILQDTDMIYESDVYEELKFKQPSLIDLFVILKEVMDMIQSYGSAEEAAFSHVANGFFDTDSVSKYTS
ncbi:MAG: hypothetical protein Q4D02_02385 [Clostridia bacterium]|nr:hypothetical protein [Clostridia bacterium]